MQRLPVAAAFHSPIVAGSVAPFAKALEGVAFQAPSLPVYGNASAEPYPSEPGAVREVLASSIAKRVRFVDVVEAMYGRGVRTFVEVGPGSVLSAMIGRICGDRPHRAIPLDRPGRHGVTSLWQSLAQIAVAGHAVDFSALWREFDLGPDPRAEPKPKMTVRISGTNYGKKYPPEGGAAGLPRPNPPRAQVAKRSNGEVMETKEQKSSVPPETLDGRAKPPAAAMPRAPAPARANGGRPHGENGNGIAANGSAKAPAVAEPPPNGATLVTRASSARVAPGRRVRMAERIRGHPVPHSRSARDLPADDGAMPSGLPPRRRAVGDGAGLDGRRRAEPHVGASGRGVVLACVLACGRLRSVRDGAAGNPVVSAGPRADPAPADGEAAAAETADSGRRVRRGPRRDPLARPGRPGVRAASAAGPCPHRGARSPQAGRACCVRTAAQRGRVPGRRRRQDVPVQRHRGEDRATPSRS